MNEKDQIERLRQALGNAPQKSIVFFGGAGVSTESGIPDFRSADGLYSQAQAKRWRYAPETMLSRTFFDAHPAEFFEYYFDTMVAPDVQPNQAHRKLAQLEAEGRLISVVTQNIDGLHQAAGSKTVRELHGTVTRNRCLGCGWETDAAGLARLHEDSLQAGSDGVPRCPQCGNIVKPLVVLYEEALGSGTLEAAVQDIARASIMLVAGTSLAVQPAASLLGFFRGDLLAIVNRDPTPQDSRADICIHTPIGKVMDF